MVRKGLRPGCQAKKNERAPRHHPPNPQNTPPPPSKQHHSTATATASSARCSRRWTRSIQRSSPQPQSPLPSSPPPPSPAPTCTSVAPAPPPPRSRRRPLLHPPPLLAPARLPLLVLPFHRHILRLTGRGRCPSRCGDLHRPGVLGRRRRGDGEPGGVRGRAAAHEEGGVLGRRRGRRRHKLRLPLFVSLVITTIDPQLLRFVSLHRSEDPHSHLHLVLLHLLLAVVSSRIPRLRRRGDSHVPAAKHPRRRAAPLQWRTGDTGVCAGLISLDSQQCAMMHSEDIL